jgi:hypothetical protein
MSFFLTEEQEYELNEFIDEQNRKVCEEQLSSDTLPEELKEIIRKTVEAGSPIPAFDPQVGYYSISFTPTSEGNRIYVHHHLADVSYPIYDPLQLNAIEDSAEETPEVSQVEVIDENQEFPPPEPDPNMIDPSTFGNTAPQINLEEIESVFGPPPQEVLDAFAPPPQLESK